MKIELGQTADRYQMFPYTRLPRVLLAIRRPYPHERRPWCRLGRLYRGYVGLLLHSPLIAVTLWIHKPMKGE